MKRFITTALLAPLALAACGSDSTPAPTVTTTSTVTTTATATRTAAPVSATPKACLDALDLAEQAIGYGADVATSSNQVISTIPDLLDAIQNVDLGLLDQVQTTIESETAKVDTINGQLEALAPEYRAAAAKCRSSR